MGKRLKVGAGAKLFVFFVFFAVRFLFICEHPLKS